MNSKNIKELEKNLLKEIKKAMSVASDKMLADMYDETGGFYTQGNPVMYERTGALGDTPRATSVYSSENQVSFDVYLDDTDSYTTGKNPTMHDILELTNYGKQNSSIGHLKDTLGKKGYWERAEKKIEDTFNKTMSQFFNK